MANNRTLRKVFAEVQTQLDSGRYTWISQDNSPEDYFDWGMSHQTTSQDIIAAMIQEGDLAEVTPTPKELGYTNTPWPLTFEEFKALAEKNACDDQWLFGEGWDIIRSYPEYCDRLIAEAFRAKMEAQE